MAVGDEAIEHLLELVARYDGLEHEPRAELIAQMRALGGIQRSHALAASDDPGRRRAGARVMELLAHPSHLPVLEPLVRDPDAAVARAARRALHHQLRTPQWHAMVDAMLGGPDPGLRSCAQEWLAEEAL